MARGEELGRFQWLALELSIVQRNSVREHQTKTKVYLAAFQPGQHFKTTSLRDFHLHVPIALRVAGQELRKHAFDVKWRGGDFQHTRHRDGGPAPARRPQLRNSTNRQSLSNCSPSPVKSRRRPTRSNCFRPSSCSRSLMCLDGAGWAIRRRSEALEGLPSSATVTKVRVCRSMAMLWC